MPAGVDVCMYVYVYVIPGVSACPESVHVLTQWQRRVDCLYTFFEPEVFSCLTSSVGARLCKRALFLSRSLFIYIYIHICMYWLRFSGEQPASAARMTGNVRRNESCAKCKCICLRKVLPRRQTRTDEVKRGRSRVPSILIETVSFCRFVKVGKLRVKVPIRRHSHIHVKELYRRRLASKHYSGP